MAPVGPLRFFFIFFLFTAAASVSFSAIAHEQYGEIRSVGRRFLLGFKETPRGSNVTFECSPSGPCVPCLYSEKNNEKYRCSETGYRIPFKCKEITKGSHPTDGQETQHDEDEIATKSRRNLLDGSPPSKRRSQSYTTYRSCVPSANEEKLSVIGFEGMMLGLLFISGTMVYVRKRRTVTMPGVSTGRSQVNSSRF
ncbi:PREDICTED: uncharacterized protein LOC104808792 [Tarenaya hassleriana]|uniref:uncharacterized protein LOC104808792 n=1 Tax=Tarenaya hassleriana TaxID=28532 RepID=UPI00053C5DAC|nr:PREDICTED: uncharacterized protein LOC104808792 [Tarenaya hassleriana]